MMNKKQARKLLHFSSKINDIKVKMMRPLFLLILGSMLMAAQASNADVLVSGSGSWNPNTPTSSYSASSATWSFSFGLTSTLASNQAQGTNFSYYLNGVLVGQLLNGVTFNNSASGGLFSLSVPSNPTNSGSTPLALTFTGGQAYTPGSGGSLIPTPGTYSSGASISVPNPLVSDLPPASGSGSGTISITNVPEPASLPLFMLGAAALGFAAFARRRTI